MEKKTMNKLDAIQYLIDNEEYNDEWSGAGMYHAVKSVMLSKEPIEEKSLKYWLLEAKNF